MEALVRKTAGKAALEPILLGDKRLAAVLVEALAASDEVDRVTHGFHTWPAGLHPDAARLLVQAFEADSILDPFCGGGTTLVEAQLNGRKAIGRDLSPVALRVATCRTTILPGERVARMKSRARKLTEAARNSTIRPSGDRLRILEAWYAPHALCELEAIRAGIAECEPDVQPLLYGVFSSIVVKTSWRRSDTSAQRVKHKRPPGTTAILFHKKARELGRRLDALRETCPDGTTSPDLALQDARRVRVPRPVQLVLTSPPYPSTYDYLPQQQLRHAWLDEWPDAQREIGSRRSWKADGNRVARRRWLADTAEWQQASADALESGGHLVVVIGDGLTPSGTVDTSRPTEEAALAAGLQPVSRASVEREDHARQTTRWEHILVYRKP